MTSPLNTLAVDGPVRLVTGADPSGAGTFPAWLLPSLAGIVVVLSAGACLVARWRSHRAGEPAEHAFRRLARRMGLGTADVRLVRVLARAHGSAGPVALLISDHAMARAVEGFERGDPPRKQRARAQRLRMRLNS